MRYLVTFEDSDGMWVDEPIGGDTEDEVRKAAALHWQRGRSSFLPKATVMVLYSCQDRGEIEPPAPPKAEAPKP